MQIFGAATALVTPFKNGKLDEECYAALIKRQIRLGIDIVSPMGTTGESPTVSNEEHKRCIEIAVECAKSTNTKVLAGAGSNCTNEAIDLAVFAQKAGADAILIITPYYNKPTQEGLYEHYKSIAKATDKPIMLYNVPGRTGADLRPETVARLANEFAHIYAIKEASGSMERCVELGVKTPGVAVFSGEDSINYPVMANGGKGVVSVTGNLLPEKLKELVSLAVKGDFVNSKKINDELYELNKVLFTESNPIPIKAAMYILGLIPNLEYRLPLTRPTNETMKALEAVLTKYDIAK
jgi:4-hydroxy-tetrahydrodipicolinate synthase